MTKHLNIKVTGVVQGVLFRAHAAQKAQDLKLNGFVRNMPDDSVYIEAEGEEKSLDEFIGWCYTGSPAAQVRDVKVAEAALWNFREFTIER